MKVVRRAIAGMICASVALGCISVSALWVSPGYDTTDPNNFGKIWNEKLDGKFTSKFKVTPVAPEDIVWKAEGFELAYPHAGYDRLYLEGNWQPRTRYNNTFAQWETRTRDFTWELAWPHKIWQRLQTNIPGKGWTWDYYPENEGQVFSITNRNASVSESFRAFGIAGLSREGYAIGDRVKSLYNYFGIKYRPLTNTGFFSQDSLSAINPDTGEYVISDDQIRGKVDIIVSKMLNGPSFAGASLLDVAQSFLNAMDNGGKNWAWDWDSLKIVNDATITWTYPQMEKAEPYLYYQFLIVNGLVMDGRNDTPRIVRLTGGKGTPVIEWKYAFAEADWPYAVVEAKYINGVKATDENGKYIYRIPTGEFANCEVRVTATDVEIWITDERGGSYMIKRIPRSGLVGKDAEGRAIEIGEI